MIYSINFVDMTLKLNPLAVAKYLMDTQWKEYAVNRNDIKIFQYEKDDIFEQVTVPLEKNLRDYKQIMYETICKIAFIEKKSVEQQMLYLLNPNTDILKIRLDREEVESGNIMFDDAIQLYDNARKLLAATALDIINPKRMHWGRVDDSVQQFLERCRFGQTEIGSYVVSVVCPFAELSETEGYKQLSIFSDEERCANSLTRKVTNRLMTNIATIKKKVDEGNLESLVNYEDGISSNFYEALNSLDLYSENTIVEFTAEWSPIVTSNRSPIQKVMITNDYYEPLQSVISKIKECDNERKEIIGKIKDLKAAPIIDERKYGTVVVVYISGNGKAKSVKVKLDKEDYDNAVMAHQYGKTVRLIGDLKEKPRATMENALFSIIE